MLHGGSSCSKMALIVAATAVLAFVAGIWTASTMARPRPAEASAVISPSTISPYDMQLKVKPHDLPVQYMQGDFNELAHIAERHRRATRYEAAYLAPSSRASQAN